MEIKLDPEQVKEIIKGVRDDLKKELRATVEPPVLLSTKLAMQRVGLKDHPSFLRFVQQQKIKSQKIGQTTYYNERDLPNCKTA